MTAWFCLLSGKTESPHREEMGKDIGGSLTSFPHTTQDNPGQLSDWRARRGTVRRGPGVTPIVEYRFALEGGRVERNRGFKCYTREPRAHKTEA